MFNGLWRPAWLGRGRDPLRAAFGHLEREVLEVMWQIETATVRDVQHRIDTLTARAVEALAEAHLTAEATRELTDLAHFVATRDR